VLSIRVTLSESFDESTGKFITNGVDLEFEHSLSSLSKWESTFEKPFLNTEEKTTEETLFYIEKCMLLTKNPPGEFLQKFSKANFDAIQTYINDKQTATWFNNKKNRPSGGTRQQIITAEVVYGWMVHLRIPFETQYWHLSRLFTLIQVCNEQSKPPVKMGRSEAARQQATLNAQRMKQLGTRG
jgi:hypothetical protein